MPDYKIYVIFSKTGQLCHITEYTCVQVTTLKIKSVCGPKSLTRV